MKIVIAPDSFKGSLSALEVCNAIKEGISCVFPDAEIQVIPMADGGEGTVQALIDATGGRIVKTRVHDPLMNEIEATFGILGDGKTGVIEMASASGLPLVPPDKRNPMVTTTYGTGELIRSALDVGCRKLIIGIGGSATVDGGAGMAQALGARLSDEGGRQIPLGGVGLENLTKIDVSEMDERLSETEVIVACDVSNPLTGPKGAAKVFGPQKGATPEMVEKLDSYLSRYADIIRRDIGIDVKDMPGAGAAGGLGAGLVAFLKAELRSGVDIVIEASGLKEKVSSADLVITGEGRIDGQTIFGKTPIGVAKLAKKFGLPVIAICGSIGDGAHAVFENGIDAIVDIIDKPMSLDEAISDAYGLVKDASERTARFLKMCKAYSIITGGMNDGK